jgi:hypothetical protein
MERFPSRRRGGSGERARGAQHEVRLAWSRRRPNLGQIARRPPDRSRLGLRGTRPGEHQQHRQRVGEREPRQLGGGRHDDVGIAGLHRPFVISGRRASSPLLAAVRRRRHVADGGVAESLCAAGDL